MSIFKYLGLAPLLFAAASSRAAPASLLGSEAVPLDSVEQHVRPATAQTGLPAGILGIWWAADVNKQFVFSLAKASWDPASRTANLGFQRPGAFAYPSDRTQGMSDLRYIAGDAAQPGYRFVFEPDFHSAELLLTKLDAAGTTVLEDKGLRIETNGDGSWTLRTPGSEDVVLRQIVDAAGKRTPAYHDYLKSFRASAEIFVPAVTVSKDQAPVALSLDAGDEAVVQLPGGDEVHPPPLLLTADSEEAMVLQAFSRVYAPPIVSLDGHSVLAPAANASPGAFALVKTVSGKAASVKLSVTLAAVVTIDESHSATFALARGEMRFVHVAPTSKSTALYRLNVEGTVPAPVYLQGWYLPGNEQQDRLLSADFVREHGAVASYAAWGDAVTPQDFIVVGDAAVASTHTVSITKQASATVPAGKVTLDGPAVTVTLSGVDAFATFDLVVPATYKSNNVQVEVDPASYDRFAFSTYKDSVDLNQIYGWRLLGTHAANAEPLWGKIYRSSDAAHLAVGYFADLNVANPNLTVTFRVKAVQDSP